MERLSGILTPADSPKNGSRASAEGTPRDKIKDQNVRRDSIRDLFLETAKDSLKKSCSCIILQFGRLRQNFSGVADFVTVYIAEVR